MDKKIKIGIIVVVCLIVILIGIGIYSFSKFDKGLPVYNDDFSEAIESNENEDYSLPEPESYSNQVEVIEYLNTFVLSEGDYAVFESEQGECWYFITSKGVRYSYCGNGLEINVVK